MKKPPYGRRGLWGLSYQPGIEEVLTLREPAAVTLSVPSDREREGWKKKPELVNHTRDILSSGGKDLGRLKRLRPGGF